MEKKTGVFLRKEDEFDNLKTCDALQWNRNKGTSLTRQEVQPEHRRARFLFATYLIRLSMQRITFPLTTTFPLTSPALDSCSRSPFDSAHSSSCIIRNILHSNAGQMVDF